MIKQLLLYVGLTFFTSVTAFADASSSPLMPDNSGDDKSEFECTLHQGGSTGKAVRLKSFFTRVSENTDGSFTMADFANSGFPVTVTIDKKAPEVNGKHLVKIVGARVTESPGESYWIADAYVTTGNKSIDGTLYFDDETPLPIPNLCIILETEKESPLSFISSEGESGDQYCKLLIRSYTDNFSLENKDYIEVTFVLPKAPGSGINPIVAEGDVDAPVQYFNLLGCRVDINNAPTGIYIRRQGSSTKKITIRR